VLYRKNYCDLFGIGGDIHLYKKNTNQGWCYQDGFEYNEIENALCGKWGNSNPFSIKRFVFIQMK